MAKSKKNKNKAKLNLTVREEQRNKLEQMASLAIPVAELVLTTGGPVAVSNALLLDQSLPAFIGHNLDKIGAYSKRNR